MIAVLSYALLAWAVVYGAWCGGSPERYFAAILAVSFLIDRVGHGVIAPGDHHAIAQLHLALDATALAAMGAIAISARRVWPLGAVACQTISLLATSTPLVGVTEPVYPSVVISVLPSYVINLALIAGTWAHRRRVTEGGYDRSWQAR